MTPSALPVNDTAVQAYRGRRAVLDLLKQAGPQQAKDLAAQLGVTAMAVRQHLYEMESEGLVVNEPIADAGGQKGRGRPAKHWRLTEAADRFFPDGHAELSVGLLDAMREAFGEQGIDKLLATRKKQLQRRYADIQSLDSLHERLEQLVHLRSEEGYMALFSQDPDGSYLFVENHCPICSAAAACSGLCAIELETFQEVLGSDVAVDRLDHIQAGARRCAYRVVQK
ncbi:helix-turn-helix transcriptional regulator [Rhodovibrionaceae bacterium A322]